MASFRGSFVHNIDGKGRIALPKTFRRVTGVKVKDGAEPLLVFTKGDGCVSVYTEDEWPTYERRLRDRPFDDDDESRMFALELANWTVDVPVDTVGRVLIPQLHMDLAGFEKGGEVLVLGMFDHIELWKPEEYKRYVDKQKGTFEKRAKEFFKKDRDLRHGD